MNVVKINGRVFMQPFLWKKDPNIEMYDYNDKPLQFPVETKHEYPNKLILLNKLNNVQSQIKFHQYDDGEHNDCLLCDKKNVGTGVYQFNNIRWEDSIYHYVHKHNIALPNDFIDFIFRSFPDQYAKKKHGQKKLNGKLIKKNNNILLKLNNHQILIMDALLEHGGKMIYKNSKNNYRKKHKLSGIEKYRYSEHAGLLDFKGFDLNKIIISANTTDISVVDNDIYFPNITTDFFDYEYIFHTHPPTPNIGGRIHEGVLYESPSIEDIMFFANYYNLGKSQGSIVIAPEGMYVVHKYHFNNKDIHFDEDQFFSEYNIIFWDIQDKYIKKYKDVDLDKNPSEFYSIISQDYGFIDDVNDILKKL